MSIRIVDGPCLERVDRRLERIVTDAAIDRAGSLNLTLGFRACEPHTSGAVLLSRRGVEAVVRLAEHADRADANVIRLHHELSPGALAIAASAGFETSALSWTP